MIRKTFIHLWLLISPLAVTYGQYAESSRALLWRISGNGLTKLSYLYGTIHYIPRKDFFLTQSTMKAFEECKILATEQASFMQYIPSSAWRNIAANRFLPREQTVASLMSPADFDTLTHYMRKVLRISKSRYQTYIRLKPVYLSGVLGSRVYPDGTGYEEEFWKRGQERNQHRQYLLFEWLEATQVTHAAWDSLAARYQVSELMKEIRTNYGQYFQLVKNYQSQDIEVLYESSAMDIPMYQLLVVQRNQAWMPKIQKLIHSQPTFIAVGAAHLAGPEGLIALLKQAGYVVSPVIDHTVYLAWPPLTVPGASPNDGY